jgi:hypothetical protein
MRTYQIVSALGPQVRPVGEYETKGIGLQVAGRVPVADAAKWRCVGLTGKHPSGRLTVSFAGKTVLSHTNVRSTLLLPHPHQNHTHHPTTLLIFSRLTETSNRGKKKK